jgi:hypothetical protein
MGILLIGIFPSPEICKDLDMKKTLFSLVFVASIGVAGMASATGLATCDSGPKTGWQPVEKLEGKLKEKGYTVRRIKEDGGCYEVYAVNEKGERGEFYFHPVTLEPVPTKPRQ